MSLEDLGSPARGSDGGVDADLFALVHGDAPFRPQATEIAQRPYVKRMERYRREWIEFCAEFRVEVLDHNRPFSTPPLLNVVRAFLHYQARRKKGRLGPKISVRTLQKYWVELQLEIKRQSGHTYAEHEIRDMENVVNNSIRQKECLSTKSRPKSLADGPVVRDVLHYLWALDEYEYSHPRMRIQTSLAILVLYYLGLRPGELVESSAHNGSNEGIWYGDLDIRMKANAEGQREFTVQLLVRNRKGRRGREDRDEVENLREEPTERNMCPVTHILALCFADEVFKDLSSSADLARIRFPPGRESVRLLVREDKLRLPLLRRLNYNGTLSQTKILTADYQCKYLTNLGWRAGYRDNLGTYPLRRGFGNKLDKFVTPAQRRRQMGHMNDNTFQSYISRISGVDVQAIINGKEQDQETIDWLCSMRTRLDTTAPRPSGSLLSENRFWRNGVATVQGSSSFISDFRRAIQEHEDRVNIFEGVEVAAPLTSVVSRPPPSKNLAMYLRYDEPRAAFLKHTFGSVQPLAPFAITAAVGAAYQMALQTPPQWRYPGTSLSASGGCVECGKMPSK
ncbi:hypothetical protein KC357_g2124 [Hortaea werneckii]|nr:hypothetical protein KC357_g2124 [Hortaea werneckii]